MKQTCTIASRWAEEEKKEYDEQPVRLEKQHLTVKSLGFIGLKGLSVSHRKILFNKTFIRRIARLTELVCNFVKTQKDNVYHYMLY